jgi:signal transduction histidine kinase
LQQYDRLYSKGGPEKILNTEITERDHVEKRANAFLNLGRQLSAARTPKEAAAIMLEAADALFQWDACLFDLVTADQKAVHSVICIDTINGERREISPEALSGKLSPLAVRTLEGGQLILHDPDAPFEAGNIPFGDKSRPSASIMYVPIRKDDKTLGLLSLQSYTPDVYTREDLNTLEALADHCGGALERIRAEQENERLNQELRLRLEELQRLNEDLERRVKDRTAQLEAINKELEAFSYSVSHDLRAPLRSIRGFSEVLLERYSKQLDRTGQEFLRRACQSSQQMETLIEDLLKLSRVSRSELQCQRVNLSNMAESIAADLKKNDPERDAEFVIEPGLQVRGDERLLRVAFDNLLRNSWKFTGNQPHAKIEVGSSKGPPQAFFVRDNGAGFDMAYANRLFGVFQRLHTVSEFPGTGVGLATVQRIIGRHGGRVWATGEVNRGATFYFTLPPNEDSWQDSQSAGRTNASPGETAPDAVRAQTSV